MIFYQEQNELAFNVLPSSDLFIVDCFPLCSYTRHKQQCTNFLPYFVDFTQIYLFSLSLPKFTKNSKFFFPKVIKNSENDIHFINFYCVDCVIFFLLISWFSVKRHKCWIKIHNGFGVLVLIMQSILINKFGVTILSFII